LPAWNSRFTHSAAEFTDSTVLSTSKNAMPVIG